MEIGFPNNPRKNILEEIEWIGKNGFDFLDLFLEEDQAVPGKIDVEKVKELLHRYELGIVGHTACYLPIGSPVKSLREAAAREVIRYFEVFSKLNVRLVTIHANWPRGMFSAKEGIKFQTETLGQLVERAGKYRLKLMYEPINTPQDTVRNVSKILNEVPELFLHIDIGHANLFGKKPEDFIKTFHTRLKHVHVHDNNAGKDLHLPVGCGTIDWKRVIRLLKEYYDETITLEVFSRDRDYVLLSKEKFIKLWSEL